jgi:protocatechuate 3,4-dioxygenase beta subunit
VTLDLSRGTPVAGTVTWADGEPAIGVPVVAEHEEQMRGAGRWSTGGRAYGVSLRPVFEEGGGGPEEVTGPEGVFTLRGLPPGRWRLSARPPEHAASEPVAIELEGEPVEPVAITIARGHAVEGVVVDGSGNPVPDAAVTGQLSGPGGPWPIQVLETSTDSRGGFLLAGFESGELRLRVEAPGFGRADVEVGPVSEAPAQRIVLTRTGRLLGVAVNAASGEPLTRFRVVSVRASEEPDVRTRWRGRDAGTEVVSEDGSFELDEIEEGRWAVLVRADGFLSRASEPAEVRAGEIGDVGRVELAPGAVLEGRVEDADTLQPIEGATVTVEGLDGGGGRFRFARRGWGAAGEAPSDTTGADGRFRLDGLPPGEFTLTATHHLYPLRGDSSVRVSVGEDPLAALPPVVVSLERGGTVAGRVLDGAGEAVAGAVVVAVEPDARGRGGLVGGPVETAVDGSFAIEALPAGQVTLRRSDRIDEGQTVGVRKGEVVEVVLQDAGVRVFGRVLVAGRPVQARVRLLAGTWGAPRSDWGPTYELPGVPPGEWTLAVSVRDPGDPSAPERDERLRLSVPSDVRELNHDIQLEEEDRSNDVALEGRVVDAETGEGLAGWLVAARAQGTGSETARTDETGAFSLTLTEDGEWRVAVMGVGDDALTYDAPEPVTIVAENGRLLGELPPFEATRRLDLDVRVVDVAGAPVAGAACSLINKAEHLSERNGLRVLGPRGGRTDALGRAKVTASEGGLHDLLVVVPARALLIQPQVRVGGAEVEVSLPRTGTLEIRGASEADLLDLPNGWWMQLRADQDRYGLLETRGDALLLHGLPGGSYRVRVGGEVREADVVPGPASTVLDFSG